MKLRIGLLYILISIFAFSILRLLESYTLENILSSKSFVDSFASSIGLTARVNIASIPLFILIPFLTLIRSKNAQIKNILTKKSITISFISGFFFVIGFGIFFYAVQNYALNIVLIWVALKPIYALGFDIKSKKYTMGKSLLPISLSIFGVALLQISEINFSEFEAGIIEILTTGVLIFFSNLLLTSSERADKTGTQLSNGYGLFRILSISIISIVIFYSATLSMNVNSNALTNMSSDYVLISLAIIIVLFTAIQSMLLAFKNNISISENSVAQCLIPFIVMILTVLINEFYKETFFTPNLGIAALIIKIFGGILTVYGIYKFSKLIK